MTPRDSCPYRDQCTPGYDCRCEWEEQEDKHMTKPRGPLPALTEAQDLRFAMTDMQSLDNLIQLRRELLLELTEAGWSHRMLAQLYGVTHNTIRYWMRERRDPK